MKVSDLSAVAKIASRISNPGSLTSLYRSIQLGSDTVKVCSEFGNLKISLDPTGLSKDILLDCSNVMAVAKDLPQSSDIEFIEEENKLKWKCGSAKGHWAIVQSTHQIPDIIHEQFNWVPTPGLGDALNLAGCACQAHAVSLGLYGIVCLADGDKIRLISSNTVSLAEAIVDKGTFPVDKVTMRPPVPSIIAALISTCPNCKLDITENGIYIQGDWLDAVLPLSVDLDRDLKEVADKFKSTTQLTKVNTTAVKKFITRARSLSDKHTSFTIGFSVKEGKISLTHSGISSGLEELFLCEGLDPNISYDSRVLPADLVLIALPFVTSVVLDYLPDNNLVFLGEQPQFMYIVSGGE